MNERAKILIVDDSPNNLQVLISILERFKYEIRPALSGEIALMAIDTFTPDLILLDINMPGIDGYETCRRIKSNKSTHDIPVIFISANDSTDDKLMAFQVGGVDYVTKPFQLDEVLARVNTHIELNRTKRDLKHLLDQRTHQLTQNEVRHRNLVNMLEIGIVQHAANGEIVFANPAALTLLGVSESQILGKASTDAMWAVIHEDGTVFPGELHPVALAAASGQSVRDVVMGVYRPATQDRVWLLVNAIPELDAAACIKHIVCTFNDITERRRIENALQTSLAEKTGLLNEVHHRVKNNLQVITSLLRLEAGRSDHVDTKTVLDEMQARIRAMALLHESLYRKGIFASIDLGTYLKQVVTQAFRAQLSRAGVVRLQLDLASVQVSLDQAMPCGLLVNELISNCFKHAFPDDYSGELKVALQLVEGSDQVHLLVSDNGRGLPADFAEKIENSLGLQLVSDLARQLGGKLEVGENAILAQQKTQHESSGHHTQFGVTFAIDAIKSSTRGME